MNGENDQMSSRSGAASRSCPATNPQTHGKRQRGPFAVEQGRKRHQGPAQHAGEATANHSQQNRGFERQVTGQKTAAR